MNDWLDKGINTMIDALRSNVFIITDTYVQPAKLLAAMFCLIYFAIEAYKYMTGAKQWDILAILKPFALGAIIIGWTSFVKIIDTPMRAIELHGMEEIKFVTNQLEEDYKKRNLLMDSLATDVGYRARQVLLGQNENNSEQADKAGFSFNFVNEALAKIGAWFTAHINQILYSIIERILMGIWQAAYFFIRVLQILYLYVLICIGPISWSLSILPWFKDTWIYWLTHYIRASLYGVCAQICFLITTCIQSYAFKIETEMLTRAVGDANLALHMLSSTLSPLGIAEYAISLLISILAMFCVPTMVNWFVQAAAPQAGDRIMSAVNTMANVMNRK